jgi:hypothetical protein
MRINVRSNMFIGADHLDVVEFPMGLGHHRPAHAAGAVAGD